MDIKFDAAAAEQLIKQMDKYCRGVQKETRDLLDIMKNSSGWNDNQKKAFESNINELAGDLNQALRMEADYMKTYDQRVRELRG